MTTTLRLQSTRLALLALLALPLAAATRPSGSLLTNGSFENGPAVPNGYLTLYTGSTAMPGWQVTAGEVDIISSFWSDHADGGRSLDMNGLVPGTIAQTFATTPGQVYQLVFALSGNPTEAPLIKTMNIYAGSAGAACSFDTTGLSVQAMGWEDFAFFFVAETPLTTIEFESTTAGRSGPALDYVEVFDETHPPVLDCADFNMSGEVEIGDLTALFGCWTRPCCDLDGDGTTGLTDFAILLSRWGEGC